MAISINPATKVITIPKSYLTLVGGTFYTLDTDAFRLDLKAIEDNEGGITFLKTHLHNTEVTVAGTTFARSVEILPPYTITFEDGQYTVQLNGSNNNIFDVGNGILNQNQVQIISTNSAGLISVSSGSGLSTDEHNQLMAIGEPADNADAVWDEILTGATHNIPTSAGRRVREIGAFAIQSGTAQAGNGYSITLAATATADDGIYNRNLIVLTDNTGVGQTRTIVDYDGTTKIAVIDREWRISPDATTEYQITPDDTPLVVDHGVARGGTTNTITLRAIASAIDDTYLCSIITILAGTGQGQARLVGSYDGTTKIVTICGDDWVATPDTTSIYVMMPYGVACAACIGDTALAQINAEVVDAVEDLTDEISGKWEILNDQMIIYKADNVTEVRRFNLTDAAGNPSMTNVYKRERVP